MDKNKLRSIYDFYALENILQVYIGCTAQKHIALFVFCNYYFYLKKAIFA